MNFENITQWFRLNQPLTDPIITFTILLFIILVIPYIFKKIKVPYIIGYIFAGLVIGEHGINLFTRDPGSSIDLYSTVGLLYIMFISGLEIDLVEFKKNSHKSLLFGGITFLVPFILGLATSWYFFKGFTNPLLPIILLSSIYTSHTLVAYPIISKFGITKNRTINIIIGGTLVANVLSLLILAIIVGAASGKTGFGDFILLFFTLTAFAYTVTSVFPKLARKFLKAESDHIAQYLFVLGVVFLSAILAIIVKSEAIIGAFLAGIALNPLIPATSPLKNRIDFIGNALFIPIFLIGIGMMINLQQSFSGVNTILLAFIMIACSLVGKYIAAMITQKAFRYTPDEGKLIFGLSSASAAATLAVVLLGTKIEFPAKIMEFKLDELGERLYNELGEPIMEIVTKGMPIFESYFLDAAILVILITCTVSSIYTEKGAVKIAACSEKEKEKEEEPLTERILIPISHPDTIEDLINLGLTIKDINIKDNIYAVNIINSEENSPTKDKFANELIEKASKLVAATDQTLHGFLRYDLNIGNGIYNVVSEHKITDIIIGLHQKSSLTDTFLGTLTEGLLSKCVAHTYIYHSVQPLNTINRMVVVIPENAEREIGFKDFIKKIWNLATNAGTKFVVFASETVIDIFNLYKATQTIEMELINFTDWEDFLYVSSKCDHNSGLIIFMGRVGSVSRNEEMNKISKYLNKYFHRHNYILYYPTLLQHHEEKKEVVKKKSTKNKGS